MPGRLRRMLHRAVDLIAAGMPDCNMEGLNKRPTLDSPNAYARHAIEPFGEKRVHRLQNLAHSLYRPLFLTGQGYVDPQAQAANLTH